MSGYILLECIHFFSSHFSLQVEISICDCFHSSLMDSFFFFFAFYKCELVIKSVMSFH